MIGLQMLMREQSLIQYKIRCINVIDLDSQPGSATFQYKSEAGYL